MTRVFFIILLLTAVAASAQAVSVMELLQSPRQFDGRRISVRGYYYSDWEGHALFADRHAAKRYDRSRAIWIEADPIVESPVRGASISGVFTLDTMAVTGLSQALAFLADTLRNS